VSVIKRRIEEISGSAIAEDEPELFLETVTKKRMTLRPNFAYWKFTYEENKVRSSDVYFTISSVLHNFRMSTYKKDVVYQNEYHRMVLSPVCFDRFNDGIIQSAILRTAHRPELNYANTAYSQVMAGILERVFRGMQMDVGEAANEFLLAIAQERLRLDRKDLQESLNCIGNDVPAESLTTILIEYIRKRILQPIMN